MVVYKTIAALHSILTKKLQETLTGSSNITNSFFFLSFVFVTQKIHVTVFRALMGARVLVWGTPSNVIAPKGLLDLAAH